MYLFYSTHLVLNSEFILIDTSTFAGVITATEGSKVKLSLKDKDCICDPTVYVVFSNGSYNFELLSSADKIDGFDISSDSCISNDCGGEQCDVSIANVPSSNVYFSTMCAVTETCKRRMDFSIILCELNCFVGIVSIV